MKLEFILVDREMHFACAKNEEWMLLTQKIYGVDDDDDDVGTKRRERRKRNENNWM